MAQDEIYDVFLSHAHTDAEVVECLGVRLEDEANLRVWLDKWILVPGEHWQQAMARGLEQAKTCAVCIGQQTPTGWFKEEIGRALNRQAQDNSFRVIPVILPSGDSSIVNDFLELRTWVKLGEGVNDALGLHVLVCGVKGIPPGRGPSNLEKNHAALLSSLREKLEGIRCFRKDQLVDDDVAVEFQRRLLDRFIEL